MTRRCLKTSLLQIGMTRFLQTEFGGLLCAACYLNGINFAHRGEAEHRDMKLSKAYYGHFSSSGVMAYEHKTTAQKEVYTFK